MYDQGGGVDPLVEGKLLLIEDGFPERDSSLPLGFEYSMEKLFRRFLLAQRSEILRYF